MAALDGMVLEHLADWLFTLDRLTVVLEAFIARSAEATENRRGQLAQAKRALTEVEGRIDRLFQLVEQGLMGADDPALKERLGTAKTARHERLNVPAYWINPMQPTPASLHPTRSTVSQRH